MIVIYKMLIFIVLKIYC